MVTDNKITKEVIIIKITITIIVTATIIITIKKRNSTNLNELIGKLKNSNQIFNIDTFLKILD